MRAQSIRPPRQPICDLMTAKIVANATRRGYAGNGQLTVFSTVSIFWPYGVKDPDRLKREVAAVDELRENGAWLSAAAPRLLSKLRFAFEFDVTVNGETFQFALAYPALFPATPPLVIPRDGRRLSSHQYGDGGELCLEYRPDNWEPNSRAP